MKDKLRAAIRTVTGQVKGEHEQKHKTVLTVPPPSVGATGTVTVVKQAKQRSKEQKIAERAGDVLGGVETAMDGEKLLARRDEKRDRKERARVMEAGDAYRRLPGNSMRGPGTGAYFIASDALHGGTDMIAVEGEAMSQVAWARSLDGKEYLDVAGNPIEVIGPVTEIMDWLDRNAHRYLANGSGHLSRRTDEMYNDASASDSPVCISAVEYDPLLGKRYKVYNTNWMIGKYYVNLGARAAALGAGAASPVTTPIQVQAISAAVDVEDFREQTAGDAGDGDDGSQLPPAEQPPSTVFRLILSATSEPDCRTQPPIETPERLLFEAAKTQQSRRVGSWEICVYTMQGIVSGTDLELLQKLGGHHDINRQKEGWFRDKLDWVRWLAWRLEEDRPGWINGELDSSGKIKGVEGAVLDIIGRVKEHERADKKYRIYNTHGKKVPERRTQGTASQAGTDALHLPAVKVSAVKPHVEALLGM